MKRNGGKMKGLKSEEIPVVNIDSLKSYKVEPYLAYTCQFRNSNATEKTCCFSSDPDIKLLPASFSDFPQYPSRSLGAIARRTHR